jgi:crossover junction endodeoxyribonuclease RusA
MEIEFPLSFVVFGVPLSSQASARSRDAWKEAVREAARRELPEGHWASAEAVSVSMVYFSLGPSSLDVDNIIKPILDALSALIWMDDRQVSQVLARKTDRLALAGITAPPVQVAAALGDRKPFTYIRVTTDVVHEELP